MEDMDKIGWLEKIAFGTGYNEDLLVRLCRSMDFNNARLRNAIAKGCATEALMVIWGMLDEEGKAELEKAAKHLLEKQRKLVAARNRLH